MTERKIMRKMKSVEIDAVFYTHRHSNDRLEKVEALFERNEKKKQTIVTRPCEVNTHN